MVITVNGQAKEIPDGLTILGLLTLLKIEPTRVAVEKNLDIIKKDRYGATAVNEGDTIEIVTFMAGGRYGASRPCRYKRQHGCLDPKE